MRGFTSQCMIQHLDGSRDVTPALAANRSTRTTRSDLVVIGHVDIKHELTLFRAQGVGLEGFAIAWLSKQGQWEGVSDESCKRLVGT